MVDWIERVLRGLVARPHPDVSISGQVPTRRIIDRDDPVIAAGERIAMAIADVVRRTVRESCGPCAAFVILQTVPGGQDVWLAVAQAGDDKARGASDR